MTTIWRPDLTQFDGPKYLALSHALRDAVRSGNLPEGTLVFADLSKAVDAILAKGKA